MAIERSHQEGIIKTLTMFMLGCILLVPTVFAESPAAPVVRDADAPAAPGCNGNGELPYNNLSSLRMTLTAAR